MSWPSHSQALRAVDSVGTMAFHGHFPGNCTYPISSGRSALASCRAWLRRVSCVVDSVAVPHIQQLVSVMIICALLC